MNTLSAAAIPRKREGWQTPRSETWMMELPELTQQIFHLNRVVGLSYVEISIELGIPESTVKEHLARALQHAMQRLRQLGED